MLRYILPLTFMLFMSSLSAQERKFQLTQVTYEGINQVQKFLDTNKTKKAQELLLELHDSKKIRKKLDRAYVRFYLGYFFSLQDAHHHAIKYFKEALTYDALAPAQTSNTYLNLAQLTMELQNYDAALGYLDKLIEISKTPKAQYYISKANIEMLLKHYQAVINNTNKAIGIDKKAKTAWLKMRYYSYYMLKDYHSAVKTLKKLIEKEATNKEYWLQLSSLYSILEDETRSLSSLDIMRIGSLKLSESELLQLLSWLQYAHEPYKAARIMEKKIIDKQIQSSEKNLNTLGDLYYEAREYTQAIIWYKKAAQIQQDSKTYLKIANIYANKRKYKDAIIYLNLSLLKSDKASKGSKYLLLGKAYYELSNLIEAKKSFFKAEKFQKSKKMAKAWLNYI